MIGFFVCVLLNVSSFIFFCSSLNFLFISSCIRTLFSIIFVIFQAFLPSPHSILFSMFSQWMIFLLPLLIENFLVGEAIIPFSTAYKLFFFLSLFLLIQSYKLNRQVSINFDSPSSIEFTHLQYDFNSFTIIKRAIMKCLLYFSIRCSNLCQISGKSKFVVLRMTQLMKHLPNASKSNYLVFGCSWQYSMLYFVGANQSLSFISSSTTMIFCKCIDPWVTPSSCRCCRHSNSGQNVLTTSSSLKYCL